ncbi:hypothetical protein [Enterococcus lactis]|uniref:hypothetical protein n=1 Tax=Enterococcus lactis TaxID=357441 RepID=UPI003848E860
MPNKKDLKKEKELLNQDFKNVCKEWHAIKRKLVKGQREIQKEEIELNNPMYKAELTRAFQSGEYKNRMLFYNSSVELIQEYQKNLISYGKICQKMHDFEQKIYRKREEIKNKPSYVKGSKTFEQLNYKEGLALAALKNSYNEFYPKKTADVISTINSLAVNGDVELYLRSAKEMSNELKELLLGVRRKELLPGVRRRGEIIKDNPPTLTDILVGIDRSANLISQKPPVQKSPHQDR